MRIRGVVFGSRSSGDPAGKSRRSLRSGVQSLGRFKKLETQGSFQMFNGSMEDKLDWTGTSHLRIPRSVEGQDQA